MESRKIGNVKMITFVWSYVKLNLFPSYPWSFETWDSGWELGLTYSVPHIAMHADFAHSWY